MGEGLQVSLLLTGGDFDTGIFTHVPQLHNDVVLSSRLQLAQGILHSAIAGLDFVAPVHLPNEIFDGDGIELRQGNGHHRDHHKFGTL